MISLGDGSAAASASHWVKCLRAIVSWIPRYKLNGDWDTYWVLVIKGCLPKSLAREEGIENTTILDVNLARKENPVETFRYKRGIISTKVHTNCQP